MLSKVYIIEVTVVQWILCVLRGWPASWSANCICCHGTCAICSINSVCVEGGLLIRCAIKKLHGFYCNAWGGPPGMCVCLVGSWWATYVMCTVFINKATSIPLKEAAG